PSRSPSALGRSESPRSKVPNYGVTLRKASTPQPSICCGQSDGEGGAGARLAGDFYHAAVGVDDGFADGEAKAIAARGAGAGFVGAIKALEEVRNVLGGYALTGVGDGQEGGPVV